MIAVIFIGEVNDAGRARYLQLAAELGNDLGDQTGFVSIERFASLSDPNRILSLSYWEMAEDVARWGAHSGHRKAQAEGRQSIFDRYTITIAEVEKTKEGGMAIDHE